ncbi:MAG TPA: tetratricopeptide repeat protein, partial [Terriglobales bacterium]|nr:tetratricopeptide repeat protein [Terriglobales bacterium]
MRFHAVLRSVLLLLAVCAAQERPTPSAAQEKPTPSNDIGPFNRLVVYGIVAVDDGSPLTETAIVESICDEIRHVEARTDTKGHFSFEMGNRMETSSDSPEVESTLRIGADPRSRGPQKSWRQCRLHAVLPGYISKTVELADAFQTKDVGKIMLHRSSTAGSLSDTTAKAPEAAMKAFQKGRESESKGKLEDAQKNLAKAVEIDPNFAVAWVELGRVQEKNKDTAAARHSFQQAIQADHDLLTPHEELAMMAMDEKNWKDAIEHSGEVIKRNPVNYPQDWFYQALSQFQLRDFDAAEKSAG